MHDPFRPLSARQFEPRPFERRPADRLSLSPFTPKGQARLVAGDLTEACHLAVEEQLGRLWGLIDRNGHFQLDPGPRLASPEDLIGINAPAQWAGLAVAFPATRTDYSVRPPRSDAILVGYATDRAGRSTTLMMEPSGQLLPASTADPVGHVPDVCRRALGLSTEPEPTSPAVIAITTWILDVIERSIDTSPNDVEWSELAALHPLADLVPDCDPSGLAAATRSDIELSSWESTRSTALALGRGLGYFSHEDLLWLDGPSLGRFILRGTMSPAEALWLANSELGPDVAALLAACVPDELMLH